MTASDGEGFDFDLVVIGCGVAGAAAAASAAEEAAAAGRSLRIAILERTEPDLRGGNSRWTAAYLRMTDVDTPAPGFVDDLVDHAAGAVDRAYAQCLADEAGPTLRWLEGLGVEFGELPTIFLTQSRPRLLPVGGGRAVLDTLLQRAEAAGATIVYRSTAWRLELGDDGAVAGVRVRSADGSSSLGTTPAVVIASGGFEGNPEMMTRYVGRSVRTVAIGGQHNRGEGIEMALAVGAQAAGDWSQFHAEPVDPRSAREEAVVMVYPYALLVDGAGRRFLDEGHATIDEQYEATARRILALPEGRSWIVGDQRLFALPRFDDIVQTTEPPVSAATIAELAVAIGVPPANLVRTVDAYNGAVGNGTFDPLRPDGKATVGVEPPKSNWANPVDEPPYVAWPLECSNVFTFGGLGTDLDGRVVTADGAPIPGLYAAGEVTGLYHGKYTGATSVLRGLVFGRRAGRHAARYVVSRQHPASTT
ncbi:MAG TPA: FAD-binding protein [Acidimicrobiia bacterium]|nr:FAD-binding protein [Acidimicrobiia bacterium]